MAFLKFMVHIHMNIGITGHKGLIGQSLVKRLESQGHDIVFAIDKVDGDDIRWINKLSQDVPRIDRLYHLASKCKINECIEYPSIAFDNNVLGTHEVMEFARHHRIPHVVAFSSSRVLCPQSNPYTASKVYLEELARAYTEAYGIEHTIIRPSTVYGPGVDRTSRLMSNFIVACLKGQSMHIYGNSDKTLDFTYIDDFLDGVDLAVEKGERNEAYNISGGEEKITTIAHEIPKLTGNRSGIIFHNSERAQPQQVSVDTSKIRALGYEPKVSIQQGIQKMVDWYRENPAELDAYVDHGRQFVK